MTLRLLCISLLLIFAGSPTNVYSEEEPTRGEVGVFVEYIQLDEPTATKLMRTYGGDGTALREKLQQFVDDGKSQIIESSFLLLSSGTTGEVESVTEYFYPTEYQPPNIPTKVTGDVGEDVILTTPAFPANFDHRNLGNVLKVKAEITGSDKTIKMQVSPGLTDRTGKSVFGKGIIETTHPTFFALRTSSNVTVESGKYVLLSVQSPVDPKADELKPKRDLTKRVFIMVRATISKGKVEDKAESK